MPKFEPLNTESLKELISKTFQDKSFGSNSVYLVDRDMFSLFSNTPNVYFLCDGKNNEIVYIGQTKNLYRRIDDHMRSNKVFHSFLHLPVAAEHLDFIEMWLIDMFRPKYNIMSNGGFMKRLMSKSCGGIDGAEQIKTSPDLQEYMLELINAERRENESLL